MPPRSQTPTDLVCVVPQQVLGLGLALAPVSIGARQAMVQKVKSSGNEFMTIEDLTHHMGVINQALIHLSGRLEGLTNDVIQNDGASAVEVGRSVGRLEQVLSEFVDGYLQVKAAVVTSENREAKEARSLMLGVYRHHIREICDWIDQMVEVIANPVSAISQRGITASANVELTVSLNLTRPPQMDKLDSLAKRLLNPPKAYSEPLPDFEQPEKSKPGILGLIGALAFGIGVSQEVFGSKHD